MEDRTMRWNTEQRDEKQNKERGHKTKILDTEQRDGQQNKVMGN